MRAFGLGIKDSKQVRPAVLFRRIDLGIAEHQRSEGEDDSGYKRELF